MADDKKDKRKELDDDLANLDADYAKLKADLAKFRADCEEIGPREIYFSPWFLGARMLF